MKRTPNRTGDPHRELAYELLKACLSPHRPLLPPALAIAGWRVGAELPAGIPSLEPETWGS